MSTARKFVHINAYPEVLHAILMNELTSTKKMLTAALVTHSCTCVSFTFTYVYVSMNVGPCHHGMARPRVADGGTATNMEGTCE